MKLVAAMLVALQTMLFGGTITVGLTSTITVVDPDELTHEAVESPIVTL